jgi:predicted nucleotidyltransferase
MVSIFIEEIKTDYPDDVAIMSVYGSYIHNATHEQSDIDFYFIPKSEIGIFVH